MNEAAPTPPIPDPPWFIIYLREDIKDLRQELRQVNNRIDSRFTVLMATMIGLSGILAGLIKF
jgi:hypothetical protein